MNTNELFLELGKNIDQVMVGVSQIYRFRIEDKFVFVVMLSNIDLNDEDDREMAELLETDGTSDAALPCRYLNELTGGHFTGDHLPSIINLIKVDSDAEPRYYYLNNKLFINCGQIVFTLYSDLTVASVANQLQ